MSLLSPQLEAFMAVARQGTVQQAARDLGLTQTGVTQRLRSLESRLSTTLFTRSRRGMRPTPEAIALQRYCRAALELEGEVMAKIETSGKVSQIQVRLSGPSSIMRSRVIPQAAALLKEFPELLFSFDLDDDEECLKKLRSGLADIAVVPREMVVAEMDSKILAKERYILVGSRDWKDKPLEEVLKREHIVDFDSKDKMTLNFLKRFKLMGNVQPVRHLANNTDAIASMVQEGAGYSVLDEGFARRYLDAGRLINLAPGKVLENSLALCWYPRAEMPSYFKALIKNIA